MNKRTCFVVAPIGNENSETRRNSDLLLKYVIRPVILECGYEDAVRADKIAAPGIITSQVLQRILQVDLVIADLSERNANVFYELAIRHATRKPLIQMIAKGEQIPFDVGMVRTIYFDIKDLESVDQTKETLTNQIRHLIDHPDDVESPLSQTLDIHLLKRSEKPEERTLGELLYEIAQIKSVLGDIQSRITPPSLLGSALYGGYRTPVTTVVDPSDPPAAPGLSVFFPPSAVYAPSVVLAPPKSDKSLQR